MWAQDPDTEDDAWEAILDMGKLPHDVRSAVPPRDKADEILDIMIRQWRYSQYHRAVLPAARDGYECRLRATRAIRTAKHWADAHHQWIEAVDDARRALAAWTAAAEAREKLENDATLEEFLLGGQAGMPKERLIPPYAITQPKLAATDFEETYRNRRALANVTLKRAVPRERRDSGCRLRRPAGQTQGRGSRRAAARASRRQHRAVGPVLGDR